MANQAQWTLGADALPLLGEVVLLCPLGGYVVEGRAGRVAHYYVVSPGGWEVQFEPRDYVWRRVAAGETYEKAGARVLGMSPVTGIGNEEA